jgi:hypothetical protein
MLSKFEVLKRYRINGFIDQFNDTPDLNIGFSRDLNCHRGIHILPRISLVNRRPKRHLIHK